MTLKERIEKLEKEIEEMKRGNTSRPRIEKWPYTCPKCGVNRPHGMHEVCMGPRLPIKKEWDNEKDS